MSETTLILVESPSKIKTIQKILGPDYVIRASFGHIYELICSKQFPIGLDINNDFELIYDVIKEKKDRVAAILDAARSASLILLGSDADAEGESIALNLQEIIIKKYPEANIKRIYFREITKAAIKKAIENPTEINLSLCEAQKGRRAIDRITGYLGSPVLMNMFGSNQSCGRCQSPTISLIIKREAEIDNFKPETYFNIFTTFTKNNQSFTAKYNKKVISQKIADQIKKDLDQDTFKVSNIISEEKLKYPQSPLNTSALQQLASKKYNFNPDKTMKNAQLLYQSGYISYMRTDSVRLSPEAIFMAREYLTENKHDLPEISPQYKDKENTQGGHEAIRPTDISKKAHQLLVSEDEKKIYALIWERFVASQMKPAIYDSLTVLINSSSNHELKAIGKTLKYKGWLSLIKEDEKDEDEGIILPPLEVGEELFLTPPKIKLEKKQTQPPPRYKVHSLVKELEKLAIGRPSTFATIISKITERKYVELKKDTYYPTELGKKVVEFLSKYFEFMDLKYTSHMEDKLDLIADGKLTYIEMITEFYNKFIKELDLAANEFNKDTGLKCILCDRPMRFQAEGKFGSYIYCSGRPLCKYIKSAELINNKIVIKENKEIKIVEDVDCPVCNNKGMVVQNSKFGSFYGCINYPKCKGTKSIPYNKPILQDLNIEE